MKQLVVVTNKIHPDGIARLREKYDVCYFEETTSEEERAEALLIADALIVRSFKVPEGILDTMPRLQVVVKRGAGYNNIDVPAATERGIVAANTPGANATGVVEGTVALILGAMRGMRHNHEHVRTGNFQKRLSWPMGDLWGRKIGIVGFGNVGRRLAQVCGRGFEMQVTAYDPFVDAAFMKERGVTKTEDLMQLMRESDVVSVHCPLTEETLGMIGAKELAVMKPTAVLVNSARGEVVDEEALIDVLRAGKIRGAGIDVFNEEPPSTDSGLMSLDNVTLSPHNAGSTEGCSIQAAVMAAEIVDEVLSGRQPEATINKDVWDQPNLRQRELSSRPQTV